MSEDDDDRSEAITTHNDEDNAEMSEGKHYVESSSASTTMQGHDEERPERANEQAEPELELTRSSRLKVLSTPDKGRGVFARESIPADTLIEVSPVLIVSNDEYKQHTLNKTIFESYLFTWSRGGDYALALGLGSLFNHSDSSPNVSYVLDKVNQCIRYTTKRLIKKDEELCIFYGHGVRFGDKGELLVEKAVDSEDEEENVLKALGGLPADSEEEDCPSDGSNIGEEDEEGRLIPLADIPLDFVTGILAPEDIPLETCKLSHMPLVTVAKISDRIASCSQRLRPHLHPANIQLFPQVSFVTEYSATGKHQTSQAYSPHGGERRTRTHLPGNRLYP